MAEFNNLFMHRNQTSFADKLPVKFSTAP